MVEKGLEIWKLDKKINDSIYINQIREIQVHQKNILFHFFFFFFFRKKNHRYRIDGRLEKKRKNTNLLAWGADFSAPRSATEAKPVPAGSGG
jgi:hypothetical protein